MASRGIWHFMSARTRRSLTLTWTALFVLSMVLQYFSFAAAAPVLAVHNEGLFELDGNVANAGGTPGDDWASHPGATGNRFILVNDPLNSSTDNGFTGGGSKDDLNTSSWGWNTSTVTPDKDDIEHAFAASYESGGDTFVYFGLDKFAVNGDSNVGFWFFKNGIGTTATGFTPVHTVGDLFVVSQFTNGGAVSVIDVYEWVGSGGSDGTLDLLATGNACTGSPAIDLACAVANTTDVPTAWDYTPKSGTANVYPPASFFEGGLNLDELFDGDAPCFSGFLAETRTSQEVNAVLKDFALGAFNTCVPPTIATQASTATADFGAQVTDTATLSGNDGPASGSVTFFICTPAEVTAAGCPSGGSQVGSPVAVTASANGGTATSAAYTVGLTSAAVGKYCWRAVYAPDQASQYLAGSHTDAVDECFTVAPATIDIAKTANPAGPVSAGDPIGFDIVVTNIGTGTALNVAVNDPLPSGIDWTLGTVTGGASCQITGPVNTEVLSCTKASLAAAASFSAHISGPTDAADCKLISNTASVSTSNDGTDQATASVTVQCPDVTVVKTPDGGDVNAGSTATFTIVVSNLGPGIARSVTLTDNLPAGVDWSEDSASCLITGQVGAEVLNCNFGDMASGASATVHISGLTDANDCGNIPNLATVGATNEATAQGGNNSDTGSVDVLCADVKIFKVANPVGPVNAGDTIGWDITVTNAGDGIATDVHVSDPLPAGVNWVLGAITGDTTGVTCQITGAVGSQGLTCDDPSMAATDSFSVHVSGATDSADCGTINNTANVTTGNDGSGQASASVVVQCPDLEVVKSGNGPLNAGDLATFTITLTNHGPGDAANVGLTDQLPSGAWTLGGADAGDCSINGSNLLTCSFGTVDSGDSRTITVSKTTSPNDCGTIHNEVSVSASNENTATDQFANTDDADIVVNCPDLEVVKSGSAPISAGQVATFTITVTNHGPGTAYDVTLTDQLPSGTWTLGGANAADCAINGSNLLSCDFGDLADDASRTFTVSKTTDADDCGTIHNDVTVAASNEDTANDQFPNSDSTDITVNCPDVTVVKTGNGTISAGDIASFGIVVTNLGPGIAFDVTLTDQLPDGTWTLGGANAGDCAINGSNLLSCDFGDLAGGASRTITLSRNTVAADCGTIPNTASVAASNEAESDTDNNESSDTITVDCPDLLITKTPNPVGPVSAGDDIGFDIEVSNNGDGNATSVLVTDDLPAGIAWSVGAPSGDTTGVSCTIDTSLDPDQLRCTDALMAPGDSFKVHISGTTDAADCGVIDNTAVVTTGNDGGDDDDASVTVDCPDIEVTKTASNSPISAGEDAVFAITVENVGDGIARDVVVTDNLPAGIAWTDDSDLCEIAGQTLTCELGDMDPGDTFTVHVSGETNNASAEDNDCGELPNTASAASSNEGQGDLGNNSDDATIVVECPDIAVEKTADETPIQVGEDAVFHITVSNGGAGTAVDVQLVDELPAGFAWTDDSDLCEIADGTLTCDLGDMEPGATFTVTLTAPTADEGASSADCGVIDNTAVAGAANESEDDLENNSSDASIVVECPSALTIAKSFTGNTGGTDPDLNVPLAKIGDTLHYTLTYTGVGPITNGIITDVLPVGLDYVEGSALGDSSFSFVDYDDATRTLTWKTAEDVTLESPSGSVTYDVIVLEAAAEEIQPLINIATIDSDETGPDDDTRSVAVLAPPLELTPPPTSTLSPEAGTSNPGFAMMLVLLGIAGLALGVGFVTPVPERVRRRDRLS